MKKSISIALILSAILFCSFTDDKTSKRVYSLGNDTHLFEINSDSTFIYKYVVDTFIDVVSEGKWRSKNGKDLILNSYVEEAPIPLIVQKKKTPNSKTVRQVHIEFISDKKNEQDFYVIPFTNRNTMPNYNRKRGSQIIETAFLIDSMYFSIIKQPEENTRPKPTIYYQKQSLPPMYTNKKTEAVELRLPPGESAYITINVKDTDFSHRTFNNTPVQIKGKHLIFKDSDSGKTFNLKLHEAGKK